MAEKFKKLRNPKKLKNFEKWSLAAPNMSTGAEKMLWC